MVLLKKIRFTFLVVSIKLNKSIRYNSVESGLSFDSVQKILKIFRFYLYEIQVVNELE